MRIALDARPNGVSLDRSTAAHPLANRALVALGALEVVDATGMGVPIGGAAEEAIVRARRALDVSAYGSIEELAHAVDRAAAHRAPAHHDRGVGAALDRSVRPR